MSDTEIEVHGPRGTRIDLRLRMSRFHVPPVQSALAVGKRAPIGTNAMLKALGEILPGTFERIDVEHPTIEALIVRTAHLQRVPRDKLAALVLKHAQGFMSDSEMLHLDMEIEVHVQDSLEL
jgi:hypothetical protein